jgi:hypothetical protein
MPKPDDALTSKEIAELREWLPILRALKRLLGKAGDIATKPTVNRHAAPGLEDFERVRQREHRRHGRTK